MGFFDWLMGTPSDQKTAPVRRASASSPGARRSSVFGIQVNDVVSYDDVDYIVKNRITYEEAGFYWYDYLLVDDTTGAELWLSAEDDDGVSIGIFKEIELPGIPPVAQTITVEGKRYSQTEHSHANVSVEREDADRDTSNKVEYWDFEGSNETYLSVSRWGGDYEASVGREIKPYELKIFPAEG